MDFGSVADWIVAVSAALAAWQGIKSLSAWRREEAGRRRMELAEVALSEFYEARDILKWVRSPAAHPDEIDVGSEDDEDASIAAQRDVYSPILKRLADDGQFFGRMRARRYRVQALFGAPGVEPYDIISNVHSEVTQAAKMLIQTRKAGPMTDAERTRDDAWEDTVWDDEDGQDDINVRIETAIRKAEDVFRPQIDIGSRV